MSNVIVTHNLSGHGLTPRNSGEFAVRLPFPECNWTINNEGSWPGEPELKLIQVLNGVEEIRVYKKYALIVEKASSYSWEELDPQITAILERRHTRILAG